MFWLPPTDDEDTVESPGWEYASVCDYLSGHTYGIVVMGGSRFCPWQQIYKLPDIGPRLHAMRTSGKLQYDQDTYVISVSGTKLLLLQEVGSKPDSDCCPRCQVPGVFRRTALICPICQSVLGGF